MKSADKKHLVQTILSEMAVLTLLDDTNLKGRVRSELGRRRTEIFIRQTPEVTKNIIVVKNIISRLTEKLIECEDPDSLAQVFDLVDGINTGRVFIADEGQEIIQG